MLRGSVASALSSLSLTGCTMLVAPSHASHCDRLRFFITRPQNLRHPPLLHTDIASPSFLPSITHPKLGVLPSTSCDVLVVDDDVQSDA